MYRYARATANIRQKYGICLLELGMEVSQAGLCDGSNICMDILFYALDDANGCE